MTTANPSPQGGDVVYLDDQSRTALRHIVDLELASAGEALMNDTVDQRTGARLREHIDYAQRLLGLLEACETGECTKQIVDSFEPVVREHCRDRLDGLQRTRAACERWRAGDTDAGFGDDVDNEACFARELDRCSSEATGLHAFLQATGQAA